MRRYDIPVLVRTAPPEGRFADGGFPDGGFPDGAGAQPEPLPPAQFLWQDRLYVVREVLAQWRERTQWWSGAAGRGVHGGEPDAGESGPGDELGGDPGGDPGGAPAGGRASRGRSAVQERWDAADRWVWRVQASAGRSGATGIYDLSRQGPPGRARSPAGSAGTDEGTWRLVRVCD